jgi:hypothetical protein
VRLQDGFMPLAIGSNELRSAYNREFLDTPDYREFLNASDPCNKLGKQSQINDKEFA